MQSILFLCHRLPWPPDKGDKIRSYHVLRRLAENYSVYLGTFVDDPNDWRYLDEVKAVCASVCVRPLKPWRARTRALVALARGEALTLGFYRDRVLQSWVDCVVADCKPQLALCYSSGVAPLVMRHREIRRIMDFVDTDSDKWRQYADARRGLARAVYRREARLLAKFEHAVAEQFDASLFVSEAEAGFFRGEVPAAAGKVHGVANGVDLTYWTPEREYENPYPADARVVVFAGAMDYRANVDAVCWFAQTVWPRIRAARPDACFYVVGSRPAPDVL
ncbi:MAG: TIGR03087 family PEP-CTERM/XrtA system glycosyltransferase, partial [Rhodanobacteraceae bacterium]